MILTPLTPRELEIAQLIAERELDSEDIAEVLGIGLWTVKKHIKVIRIKLGVRTMREIPGALATLAERE